MFFAPLGSFNKYLPDWMSLRFTSVVHSTGWPEATIVEFCFVTADLITKAGFTLRGGIKKVASTTRQAAMSNETTPAVFGVKDFLTKLTNFGSGPKPSAYACFSGNS